MVWIEGNFYLVLQMELFFGTADGTFIWCCRWNFYLVLQMELLFGVADGVFFGFWSKF